MKRLRLEFLDGPRRGDVSVFSASPVSLGRSRTSTFVLPEPLAPTASGHHAEFVREDDAWWVVDLGSTNGTYLNGRRVDRARVVPGDRVTIGDVELGVAFDESGPAWRSTSTLALVAAALIVVGLAGYWSLVRWRGGPQHIADVAAQSVYLIALERQGARTIVGTAFAVSEAGTLATNAHVADALRSTLAGSSLSGVRAVAIRTDSYDAHEIRSATPHPEWQTGSIAHDVALLQLMPGVGTVPLAVATPGDLRALRRGVSLTTFGFPALSTDPARPRGRLSVDVLSDVRLPYLEVGLGVAPGTSGSPVFDSRGKVVAVIVSGDFTDSPVPSERRPSGTNVNWAIAVDELRSLLSASTLP